MPIRSVAGTTYRTPAQGVDANVLAARWRHRGDRRAREELVERFLPLARKLASRYSSPREPLDDLVQVASVGLLAAIDRFDPDRGTAFRAFAVPTILGELKRHFRNTGWAMHVPRGVQEMALHVEQAAQQITARTGRNPRIDEIAQDLEVSPEQVVEGIDAGSVHYVRSLDAPVHNAEDDDSQSVIDTVGAIDGRYGFVEITASLAVALERLPELERRAFTLRIARDMRQTDIAAALGCSQMNVSRLLRRASTRLREMIDPPADPPRDQSDRNF